MPWISETCIAHPEIDSSSSRVIRLVSTACESIANGVYVTAGKMATHMK